MLKEVGILCLFDIFEMLLLELLLFFLVRVYTF